MTMTYTTLLSDIQSWLNRNDAQTIAQIPNFIYLAENQLCVDIKNLGVEKYVISNFIVGQCYYQKPANWRTPITINFGNGTGNNFQNQMYLRDYDFLVNYWPDATQTGTPLYYADYGFDNIYIAPTPDNTYPFKYAYLELPALLSTANQTNWFTNYIPNALFYGSLIQAAPFIQNDERLAFWEKMYQKYIDPLNTQNLFRTIDRSSDRNVD